MNPPDRPNFSSPQRGRLQTHSTRATLVKTAMCTYLPYLPTYLPPHIYIHIHRTRAMLVKTAVDFQKKALMVGVRYAALRTQVCMQVCVRLCVRVCACWSVDGEGTYRRTSTRKTNAVTHVPCPTSYTPFSLIYTRTHTPSTIPQGNLCIQPPTLHTHSTLPRPHTCVPCPCIHLPSYQHHRA